MLTREMENIIKIIFCLLCNQVASVPHSEIRKESSSILKNFEVLKQSEDK